MAKNKLHQLLAIEGDLRTQATKIMQEAVKTFSSKGDHFDGHIKEYRPFVEDENMPVPAPEVKEIVTTVAGKIDHVKKIVSRAVDAQVSKEETNSEGAASATLEFGGNAFVLSATSLLALETVMTNLRSLYASIPTLDPTKSWQGSNEPDVYITDPRETFRTEKVPEVVVKYDATKEHPAQTDIVTLDKNVGINSVVYRSGRISPKAKAALMGRIDALLRAVKKARAEANRVDVINIKIGRAIFDFINEGEVTSIEGED